MATPGIPIAEFVGLLEKAQRAVDDGDVKTALEINERIKTVGYSLVIRNGVACLKNDTTPEQG